MMAEVKYWNWIQALDQLEARSWLGEGGDKKPLTDLLRSDCELPKEVREWLADLIERGVPPSPNRPRTPAYTISDVSLLHLIAVKIVRDYRQQGMSEEAALEEAAKESGLTVETLRLSVQGRNSSLRRDLKKP
jgi:hypothetical protein